MKLDMVIPKLYIRGALSPKVTGEDLEKEAVQRLYALHGPGQPNLEGWEGYRHRPMADSRKIPENVHEVVAEVLADFHDKKRVVVICLEGRNRSGLVVALTLCDLGYTGAEAVARLRAARPRTLYNPFFQSYVEGYNNTRRIHDDFKPKGPVRVR